jgi:sugar lactone lactonase YvrE
MVLQASGIIRLSNIKSEFNGIDPVELSDYYRGGVYVPDLPLNANVPASGTINLQNFYGATISTFNISPNVGTVNEGGTVRFNVTTNNFSGTLFWSILGSVTNADFSSPLNAVTSGGTLSVSANTGLLDITTNTDSTTEGSESFSVRLKALSTSGPVVTQSSNVFINDTSIAPFYVNLARSTGTTLIAPNNVTFTLTSNGIPNGRTVGYTITGIQADDLSSGSLTGNFTMSNNTATVTLGIDSFIGQLFLLDVNATDKVARLKANQSLTTLGNSYQQTISNVSNSAFSYMYWKPDGTSFYLANSQKDSVDQYNMSRPFDLTSATITTANSKVLPTAISSPLGIHISSGGTNLFIMDSVDKKVYRMAIGTAWNISTLSATTFGSPTLSLTTYRGLDVSANGILYFICALSTGNVQAFKGTTAFRPDTMSATPIENFNPPSPTTPTGVRFNSDGTAMYLTDQTTDIYYYTLSTPYTLSTATLVTSASVSSIDPNAAISDVYWSGTESETLTMTTASSDSGGVTVGLPKSNAVIITN